MTKKNNQNSLKQIIDNLLLVNLFTVIFFAIFFIFAIIMQINGKFIFINFIQRVWNPLIVPLITVLIIERSVPNLFAENKGVVAEGFLEDRNYFKAVKILAKHDENYMPPEVKEALGEK